MSHRRNVRWGLCVSVVLGLPVACGDGSDAPQNTAGAAGTSAGAGGIAGAAQAGQPSTAGTSGAANQAGAGDTGGANNAAGAGGTGANGGTGGKVAGNAGGGQTSTGGGGASNAGSGGSTAGSAGSGGSTAGSGGSGGSTAGSAGSGGSTAGSAGSGGSAAGSGGSGGSAAGSGGSSGSAAGSGGSSGSAAGSGGSGGAAQIGCGSAAILDDMEDGNAAICPHPVRAGGWYVATSGAAVSTTPTASSVFPAFSLVNDPHGTSQYGMRLSGSGFTTNTPWATLGASVSVTAVYDATAYTSISFWVKSLTGPMVVRFNLSTTETRSVANGGTCTGVCDDSFGKFVSIDGTWQQYIVAFSSVTQSGWGTTAALNMAHLHTAEFNYVRSPYMQSVINPSAFGFIVDDLQFN